MFQWEITSIGITTDKRPTQDIERAEIAHTNGSQFTFNTCTYNEKTWTDLANDSFVTSELAETKLYPIGRMRSLLLF